MNTDKMAEIIICLTKNFGKDPLIKFLIDRLIRKETYSIVPAYKSEGVIKLEKEYNVSVVGKSRNKIYGLSKGLSSKIVIEHGFPEGQAIEMCFKETDKTRIKDILDDVTKNLTYITEEEHKQLDKSERRKGESGYYWEDIYRKVGITVHPNAA